MLTYPTPSGGGLYLIRLSDTHYYGGRARSFHRRWWRHLKGLQEGRHPNPHMQAVFSQHHRFEPVVLLESPNEAEAIAAEQAWLDEHLGKPGCVNLSPNALGGNSINWTKERRAALSSKMAEVQKGRTFTERHRANIAGAKRGQSLPAEARAKIGQANSKRQVSEETRQRMRDAQRARWADAEKRQHLLEAQQKAKKP